MTTKAEKETIKQEALKTLREMLPPGSTIYTILRHVSKSGMYRVIEMAHGTNEAISWVWPFKVKEAGFYENHVDKYGGGWAVNGCGMDMGFHLVYNLSSMLYRDGYPCLGEKCPANDHLNGDRDYTPNHTIHKDGGYALKQRWI